MRGLGMGVLARAPGMGVARQGGGGFKLPYTVDFSTLADGAMPAGWSGATWAIASGQAVNTPALGAEALANNGFDTDTDWTKGSGWTIDGGVAVKAATASSTITQSTATLGLWYQLIWTLATITAGTFCGRIGATNTPARNAPGTFTESDLCLTSTILGARAINSTSAGTVDNVSAKPIVPATLMAYYDQLARSAFVVGADWNILAGNSGGIVGWWDGVTPLQNCLVARHDGTNATLAKYLGATRTQLVNGAAAYSAGATLEIRRAAGTNTFQLFYNNVQVGTDQALDPGTDAAIISNGYFGLFSTLSGNGCVEFSLS